MKVRTPKGNVSATANHLGGVFPRLFPGGPAPPSPVGWEPGSSHVEDYPCCCSLETSQPREEMSGNATWDFSSFPSSHAPRLLPGREQLQLSQPCTDQPPKTQTGGLPTRPTTPAPREAEPEVRRPEVALSMALAGLSLPESRLAQPRLYGVSLHTSHTAPAAPLREAGPTPPLRP